MRTAFVTGVTGQTGSYLAEQLVASGDRVIGLVRGGDSTARDLLARTPEVTLIEGDLSDPEALRAIVLDVSPDVVFNLGGLTSVAASWSEPLEMAKITGMSAAALLDAALESQKSTGRPVSFVQASSAEIFGSPEDEPQSETTVISPTNPYGAAKAYAHFLVGTYRTLGLRASSCILYNHESPRRPEGFVTRKITKAAARIALGLQDNLVLGSLDSRRDWGWAPDYAAAMNLVSLSEPADYVIATGEAHSVEEFVAEAFLAAGIEDWRDHVSQDEAFLRPADAVQLRGDSTRIRRELGWSPTLDFAGIVGSMVRADLEVESQVDRSESEG